MLEPSCFEILYSINPFMQDAQGQLKKVDQSKALLQWSELKKTFESIEVEVEVLPAHKGYPDMVFCANHALVQGKTVLLSHMNSKERLGEPELYRQWYELHSYKVVSAELLGKERLEGAGDALWSRDGNTLFAGYGFRSTKGAYAFANEVFSPRKIVYLRLVDSNFYHLDTCFSVLDENTVAIVESAFDSESLARITENFSKIIKVSRFEAIESMAVNCFCPDGKNVVLQHGAKEFVKELSSAGFSPIEVDTSEFIKAGGSVFCMKAVLQQ